jgi:hypothetical protein
MTELSRPNLKLFATIAVDERRGTCPTCGNPQAYRADLEQFGRCVNCAEAILGTRPVLLRELFVDDVPDPGVSDDGQETAREAE